MILPLCYFLLAFCIFILNIISQLHSLCRNFFLRHRWCSGKESAISQGKAKIIQVYFKETDQKCFSYPKENFKHEFTEPLLKHSIKTYFPVYFQYIWCCAVLCLSTQSCPTLCDPMDCNPPGTSVHEDSPGKNTGVLLQGILPTQGLNPGLLHCRQIFAI